MDYELFSIGSFHLKVINIVGAVVIYVATQLMLGVIKRLINRGLSRLDWDKGRRHSLFLIAQYFVWILAITAMLESLGIHVSVLIASSAAILVGLGLGVQQIFRDVVSGVFLLFEGTIEVGDVLTIDSKVVKVVQINLRTTQVITRDGITLILPNSRFITESVANWSHIEDDGPIQYVIQVFVVRESDEITVHNLMMEAAQEHPDVLQNEGRKPVVRLSEFRVEGSVAFTLVFWSKRKFDAENMLSDLRYGIRKKLREKNISLPEPA